jgi:predicted small metal-binding protein
MDESLEWRSVGMPEARKFIDCRQFPSETNCSLMISGREDEVLKAAVEHAVSAHGHTDSPELREALRSSLQDERTAASA